MQPCESNRTWKDLNWKRIHYRVRKLQKRIALAAVAQDWRKVSELQKVVYQSWYCRAAAVQRVTSRKNIRTPGIDGKFWFTDAEKYAAVEAMDYRNYTPRPFKRIYVPKDHDKTKTRPLSVPVIFDRAMQGLFLIAVDPVVESLADAHAYGFRKFRSSQDAAKDIIEHLGFDRGNIWVLKADVKECFDHLSHSWILEHAPMNKQILGRILTCGYQYKGEVFPTVEGMPQGGVLSPTFTTLVLCGFEDVLRRKYPGRRVQMVRFVDDFLFSADSRELLMSVVDDLRQFLAARTLELSESKTQILPISEGVDFIGWCFRRDGSIITARPTEQSISELRKRLRDVVDQSINWTTKRLIRKLNGIVRGWSGYHKYLCSNDVFVQMDDELANMLWVRGFTRHPKHTSKWVYSHYWRYSYETGRKDFRSGDEYLLRFARIPTRVVEELDLSKNPYIDYRYFKQRVKTEYNYQR